MQRTLARKDDHEDFVKGSGGEIPSGTSTTLSVVPFFAMFKTVI